MPIHFLRVACEELSNTTIMYYIREQDRCAYAIIRKRWQLRRNGFCYRVVFTAPKLSGYSAQFDSYSKALDYVLATSQYNGDKVSQHYRGGNDVRNN